MVRRDQESPGSARLELVDGVFLLHPEDAVLDGMLDGWEKQQRGRRLDPETIDDRRRLIRRFVDFSGEYPWNWTTAHMDEWSFSLNRGTRAGEVNDPLLPGGDPLVLRLHHLAPLPVG
ncbi:hypothetical protein [Streptomyces sp. NBC_01314]|uniref:hypothetical protein n=1 Tax=Streptomyces sp. NBC_01314 TaxID=2903821 RepID=UPI00352F9C9A